MREGSILWRPKDATYIEGPSALIYQRADGRHLAITAHAGGFRGGYKGADKQNWNPVPYGPGFEAPVMIDYGPAGVQTRYPLTDVLGRLDTHENGFGCSPLLMPNGDWVFWSCRTTWSSWLSQQASGIGNRSRMCLFRTPDPLHTPYELLGLDIIRPADWRCVLRNTDHGNPPTPSTGPHMAYAVAEGDGFLLMVPDDVGLMSGTRSRYILRHCNYRNGSPVFTIRGVPDFPPLSYRPGAAGVPAVSDIAQGPDGTLYALLSSYTDPTPGWWFNARRIDEWVSHDRGLTWSKGARSWALADGGLVWDAGYMRDPQGGIDPQATGIVALTDSQGGGPWAGGWALHWWADLELPATFGQEPPPDDSWQAEYFKGGSQ